MAPSGCGRSFSRPLTVCLLAVFVDYTGVSMMRTLLPFRATALAGEHAPILIGSLESAYGEQNDIGLLIQDSRKYLL